ncbi:hypothetical protein GUJ93_ZPchr0006g44880 [Zizania palustris]|uniref:RIN4 pathogenic type III effector avirulence factor Avr cleavage site domain-containing protein n=1 Tax=Zizania palustris TaxID=103762 RepID=A0A8J5SXU3_ZIZPA|nr:hypothetical protein GUJ93_ZPchr0006g44880 [Zizania palustris]
MSQRGIPAFGDWSTTGDTPYTQKFENLRRSKKTGVYSNPNESRANPEPPRRSPLHPSSYCTPDDDDALQNQKQKHQGHERKPETDHPRPAGSPLHRETLPSWRHANPLHQHHLDQRYGSSPRSPYREAAAATASPRSKHRSAGMMQTSERKPSSEGRAPVTPGRSRLKQSGRGFEAAEDEVTVPPFGDWDDSNAESGEKYTGIFNRVRHDKLSPNVSVNQPASSAGHKKHKVQQVSV